MEGGSDFVQESHKGRGISFLQLHLLLFPGHEFMALARQLTLTLTATDAAATSNLQPATCNNWLWHWIGNREWNVALGTQMNLCMQSRIKGGTARGGDLKGTNRNRKRAKFACKLTDRTKELFFTKEQKRKGAIFPDARDCEGGSTRRGSFEWERGAAGRTQRQSQ